MSSKNQEGLNVSKEKNFAEWYTQVIQKAELIEYSPVSGCYTLRPRSYAIWEKVQAFFDQLIKEDGVENAYFPLFIPESLLNKEEEHVEGFAPEVAWVETGGKTKLKERLAVRPTSETIMYDAYAKWIRSYNDLPLRLNQWCNVVRWEFKHAMPFIRGREFLWQEGHTVFATQEEAVAEAHKILDFYERVYKEMYAMPVLKGRKADTEKFAGADFSLSLEPIMPNGKAAQGCTSHCLGQNFSKAFGITFTDKDQKEQFGWQNSWGISTRSIGTMIMVHSDDKGLVLPPPVAQVQAMIIPILFKGKEKLVLDKAQDLATKLKGAGLRVKIDDRADYSPGYKFSEWELKGVPVRIELGPRDIENNQVMVARRDTGEKQALLIPALEKELHLLLEQMHANLYSKAQEQLKAKIVEVTTHEEAAKAVHNGKVILGAWCEAAECEASFKEATSAKTLNAPFDQEPLKDATCCLCQKPASKKYYLGRSY